MDIDKIRKDTPGCHDKLFFNSAGSSLNPHGVIKEITSYLNDEEQIGGYSLAQKRKGDIAGFYQEAALLINAQAHNIAFTSSATDAFSRALSAIPFSEGDVILTTDDDYVSSYIQFISLQHRFGIRIERINNLENGDLDLENFTQLLEKYAPKLVTITHIPTSSGLIQDVESIGKLCRDHDTCFLLDACQSAGQLKLDVHKLNCDFMSVTGRKFLRGPRGTGFLYVADRILQNSIAPLFPDMRGATWTGPETYNLDDTAKRFEQFEMPYSLMMGFKAALGYANELGLENIEKRNLELSTYLREQLSQLDSVSVYDRGTRQGSIVTFLKKEKSLRSHIHLLRDNNVFFSITTRESALFDFEKKGVDRLIRLSPHYFNTHGEIDDLAEIIAQI